MTLLTKRINTSISTLLLMFSTIFPQVSSYNPFKKFCPYIPFHIRSFHVSNSTSFYFNLSLPKPHLKHPSEQQKPLLPQAPMSNDDYFSDSPSHTRAPHRETPHSAYYTSTKRRILGTSPSLPSLPFLPLPTHPLTRPPPATAHTWGPPWSHPSLLLHTQKYKVELFGKSRYEYRVELRQKDGNGSLGDKSSYFKKKDDAVRDLWDLVHWKDWRLKEERGKEWERERGRGRRAVGNGEVERDAEGREEGMREVRRGEELSERNAMLFEDMRREVWTDRRRGTPERIERGAESEAWRPSSPRPGDRRR